jgi:hypothetical protein
VAPVTLEIVEMLAIPEPAVLVEPAVLLLVMVGLVVFSRVHFVSVMAESPGDQVEVMERLEIVAHQGMQVLHLPH